jgi:hypothetical protein
LVLPLSHTAVTISESSLNATNETRS